MRTLKRPIIGTFVNHSVIRRLKKQDYEFNSYQRIIGLSKASVDAGVTLYYFSVRDFDLKRNVILGTIFDIDSNQWKQYYFPLPDILYNRRAGGGSNKYIGEHIENVLNEHQVIKVNSQSYFDKWEFYQDLSQNTEVRKYLPYSVMYQDESDLEDFLKLNNEAYLKGVRGGRGRAIFRVRQQPTGKFEYSYFVDNMFIDEAECWDDLVREVHKFFGKRKFIIQKAIKLIKVNESNIDFRAELQRDGEGKVNIIGVCARIGESRSPITIHSSAYPIEEFLKEFLSYSDDELNELIPRIHQFLFTIYEALEKEYGIFGEIGIDFGIDQDGELWFIEPNSKSAKVSLMKAYDQETFYQALLNPLLFSKYLYMKKNSSSDQGWGAIWQSGVRAIRSWLDGKR